jgi:hypothetical protein
MELHNRDIILRFLRRQERPLRRVELRSEEGSGDAGLITKK